MNFHFACSTQLEQNGLSELTLANATSAVKVTPRMATDNVTQRTREATVAYFP